MGLLIKLVTRLGWPSWVAAVLAYVIFIVLAFTTVWAIYNAGQRDERELWQAKKIVDAARAQSAIDALTVRNEALGKLSLGIATAANTHYQQELSNEKTHFNRVINDVRNGARRLSIGTKAVPADCGEIAPATSGGAAAIGETRAELSAEASEAILTLGHEVDTVVIECNYVKQRLSACYAFEDALKEIQESVYNKLAIE